MKKDSPFAARLKTLIQERDLTHREVGEAAGVTKNAVGKWLQGTVPGAGEVFKLARAFNKPMEWFFESIPYNPEPSDIDYTLGPVEIPLDRVSPELRTFYAAMIEALSTPAGKSALLESLLNRNFAGVAAALPERPQKSSTQVLTNIRLQDNISPMQEQMQRLRDRLRKATAVRGQKAALAKWLGVSMSSVSTWLAGAKEPTGETTLKLLQWVEQQEAQQKQSASSVQALPAPKTQSQKSYEKKPKSSPLKE